MSTQSKTIPLSEKISVNMFFIEPDHVNTAEIALEDIFTQIKNTPDFKVKDPDSETELKQALNRKIFGEDSPSSLVDIGQHSQMILETAEIFIKKCYESVPITSNLNVYILPLYNTSASKDLDGVNGFAVESQALYLIIDTNHKNWKQSLIETIPHEYAHIAYMSKYLWNSVLDGIVNEGLAEHFRELMVGGNPAPWSVAIPREQALKDLLTITGQDLNLFIDETNLDFYLSYFFGTKELPNWYGYSLGYWLIEYLIKTKHQNLLHLLTLSPKEIFSIFRK